MTLVKKLVGSALIAGFTTVGATAYAQQQAGLVTVNLSDINLVLVDVLDLNVSQIPVTVQAPIGVAANVCNVAANVLAADVNQDGTATCDAQSTSRALNQIVLRNLVEQ